MEAVLDPRVARWLRAVVGRSGIGGRLRKVDPPPPEADDDLHDALDELRDPTHARAVILRRAIRDVVDDGVCAATPLLAAIVINDRFDTMTRSMAALALGELGCRVEGPRDDEDHDIDEGFDEGDGMLGADAGCPSLDAGLGDMSGDAGAGTSGDDDDGAGDDDDGDGTDDDGTDDDGDGDDGDDDDGDDDDDGAETGDDASDDDTGSGSSRCDRERTELELPDDFEIDEIVDEEGALRAPFREKSGLGRFEIHVLKRATRSAQPLGLRQSAARALGRAQVSSAIDLLVALRDDASEDAALRFVAAQSLTRITGRDHFDVALRDDMVERYIEDAEGYELVEVER